jgi:hypothetical protein
MRSSAVEWKELWKDEPSVQGGGSDCRDDRMFSAEWAHRHARERLGIEPDEMDGSLYISLSRPYELADRLAAYAREVA